jgi:hypothetical protein
MGVSQRTVFMDSASVQQNFVDAVDQLVAQVRDDRSILAAVLCGSLSYDTVWAKSDVDLVFVTVDDRNPGSAGISLFANGVNVHAVLVSRAEFRKMAEGAIRNSFWHSFIARGRLLYTHDDSIAELLQRIGEIGERDTRIQLFRAATNVLPALNKARKFFTTREDLEYASLWILYTATPLAQLEVIGARQLADREVIPQAMKLNPALFTAIYTDLLNKKKTRQSVAAALDAIDGYLAARATELFAPLIEHLRDVGETRSCTEIENHFSRTFDVGNVTTACEYLADQNIIGKASVAIRLTKRSNVDVQELAFFAIEDAQDMETW